MFKPGTVLSASGTVRRCSRWMSAAVMTVTELATLVANVGIAVGLYTTVALAAGAGAITRARSHEQTVCRKDQKALVLERLKQRGAHRRIDPKESRGL